MADCSNKAHKSVVGVVGRSALTTLKVEYSISSRQACQTLASMQRRARLVSQVNSTGKAQMERYFCLMIFSNNPGIGWG